MSKPNFSIKINLTPSEQESIKSILYKWVINVGKIIILVAQIIAMSALFYRFTLDRQITDLHDRIKTKETIVKNQAEKEQEYRNLQKRLADIKIIDDSTQTKVDNFGKILPQIKDDVYLANRISIKENIFTLDADVSSVFAIPQLINSLKDVSSVDTIKINNVQSKNNSTNFTMEINLHNNLAGIPQTTTTGNQSQNPPVPN